MDAALWANLFEGSLGERFNGGVIEFSADGLVHFPKGFWFGHDCADDRD
jgi:hypothetical protein